MMEGNATPNGFGKPLPHHRGFFAAFDVSCDFSECGQTGFNIQPFWGIFWSFEPRLHSLEHPIAEFRRAPFSVAPGSSENEHLSRILYC